MHRLDSLVMQTTVCTAAVAARLTWATFILQVPVCCGLLAAACLPGQSVCVVWHAVARTPPPSRSNQYHAASCCSLSCQLNIRKALVDKGLSPINIITQKVGLRSADDA
jgi:hypothetical protein